jgi:hypothetical protein
MHEQEASSSTAGNVSVILRLGRCCTSRRGFSCVVGGGGACAARTQAVWSLPNSSWTFDTTRRSHAGCVVAAKARGRLIDDDTTGTSAHTRPVNETGLQ